MQYFSCRAKIALVAFVFLFGPIQGNNWEPCGDWIAYNDEKCFKIIDDNLRSFDEAKDVCATQEHISTLPVIRSSDEQEFLSNYLFKTEQKLENFWIGAQYSNGTSFVWIDNSPLNYTNWDAGSPRSLVNPCVHMQADVSATGKWKDGSCGKKNAVVCQRMQFWSHDLLQKTFLDSRKQQRDIIQNLTQSLASANQRIASLENVDQRINELINEKLQDIIPLGFLYTQLPNQKAPSEIWPWMSWQDLSSTYAGVFFRVEGGGAATFGQVQDENAPHVTQIDNLVNTANLPSIHTIVGGWSDYVTSGGWGRNTQYTHLKFLLSGAEVRPRNMAIRVWKRTGPNGKLVTLWDYNSLMLYGERAFGIDKKVTMKPKRSGVVLKEVYHKPGLSALDAAAINRLYKCKSSATTRLERNLYENGYFMKLFSDLVDDDCYGQIGSDLSHLYMFVD